MNKSIMVQGTASSVGKSILATALCRIFTQDGYNTVPFKSQNMSLNSYITYEGHEMGRAQVMQAEAAGKAPNAKMNPILLKPTGDCKSQIIVNGVVQRDMEVSEYFRYKLQLKEMIQATIVELITDHDIVVIEGAGSPAEINLKEQDIVNMGMAKMAKSPVILVGDIDKGGVFASLFGTIMLLDEDERRMIKGVIINKFRGSLELLRPGLNMLQDLINVPVLGVIPHFDLNLEDEDSVTDWSKYGNNLEGDLEVAVIRLPRISNFTDFNAFKLHGDVRLRFVGINEELGTPDLVIIPGSKSTIADLNELKNAKMDKQILKAHENGSTIFGICGGFQILGKEIKDPNKIESQEIENIEGLGLLPVETIFEKNKVTTLTEGLDNLFHTNIRGYEIHMGRTKVLENPSSLIQINRRNGLNYSNTDDGMVNHDHTVFGTYIHGIFDNSKFTRSLLNKIREGRGMKVFEKEVMDYQSHKEEQYDQLASIVRNHLDMNAIYGIIKDGIDD
ncbi:cobyric acid synthase [Alkaliphilus serpentinus]|uniref:Cobyric acid synthase n=1 Tax=Alkaliphilus serpentinus TaxID=1482731 RepID=A0A833HR53_9FIRM|nr:cobyric acid synthase [Alkaliphilus serpentinus]KAB3532849.1 cobyric acid synthase [Alkaliphilus serpentinus]